MSDALDVMRARLDAAVRALDKLESLVTRVGGYMSHEDQQVLRTARAALVDEGMRKGATGPLWEDRICTCDRFADGTNAVRLHCSLHRP